MRLHDIKEDSNIVKHKIPTVGDLAEKYKCSLMMVEIELKKGIKAELPNSKKFRIARDTALKNLSKDLWYYKQSNKVDENFADGKVAETKQRLDRKCWSGYKKQGTKLKNGVRVNNCVPKESVEENFADGKGPGRPGDSQRHGIPKHATIAQLEKAAKAPGRKGQLARWQLNMRRGKAKAGK